MGAVAGNGSAAAAALESAINSGLAAGATAAQQAFAGKVSVTATQSGGGNTLEISVEGLSDTQTFTIADGTGTPLADLGLAGATVVAASGSAGKFQIGANSGDTLDVAIGDMDAAALGISAIDVTTDAGAAAALTALDSAISTVSEKRGDLGALQNRFESMINNLQVTTENLVASESRIRDTDMAAEMTNFTKNQILSQAGTAMLAQANQVPQGVLSLLR
jgi:flagellin